MTTSYMAIPGIPREAGQFAKSKLKELELIRRMVCEYYEVSVEDALSKGRGRKKVDARHVTMYLCEMLLSVGPVYIGENMNSDHSGVIYGREKVRNLIYSDKVFGMEINALKKKIEKVLIDKRNAKINLAE